MNLSESLAELRKISKKRNFDQTVDLIINLKDFDPRKDSLNTFAILPHLNLNKKIAAFLENPSPQVYSITKKDIEKITNADLKRLIKEYDFFIANAKLMPIIAQKFGKILGTSGKMPDPKMGGVLLQENEEIIKEVVERLSKTVKIKAKEPSLKIAIGKESMPDQKIIENANIVIKTVIEALPKRELNLRSIMLKFTMSKPVKIKLK